MAMFTNAQTVSQDEYYNFFNSIFQSDTSRFLLDKNSSIVIQKSKNKILSDTLFTNDDKAFMIKQIDNFANCKWKKRKINNSKVIHIPRRIFIRKVLSLFKKEYDFWKTFHRKYGEDSGYLCFSIPVFTIDRKFCVVYTSGLWGGLNGRGETSVYKKEGDKWIVVKRYSMWIS